MTSTAHNDQSSFREKVLEHLFVADLLRYLWQRGITDAEILTAEVDNAGYDLVVDCNQKIRHIQLKASHIDSTTAQQKLNVRLAKKPSGCMIWMVFDTQTLAIAKYLWFGNGPGSPLPDISNFRTAKHSKANAYGLKAERPNIRVVPKAQFDTLNTLPELVDRLFGIPDNAQLSQDGTGTIIAT